MIEIMDTTLRDGEQMNSVSFTAEEKLTITRMLIEDVGVHRVEVASARVSEGEQRSVEMILKWAAEKGYADRIEMLGFTDVSKSADWIRDAGGKVVNLLCKGSLRHVQKQLRKTPEAHLEDIVKTIEYSASHGLVCNIYLEDWSNGALSSPEYVRFLLDGLTGMPIRRYLLPDTLGVLCPDQVTQFIGEVVAAYPDRHFDFHGHNDYGLATANTLAAVRAGARGVHCTINGMGERAGNTPLDEVVVCLHDFNGEETGINELALHRISETVEIFSGRSIASNKPVSGANVFTQTAGIHADGDKKENLYANPLLPERFGRKREYALGKLSGRSNLDFNLDELGIELAPEQKKIVLERIIELGDLKESITKEDLPYIIADVLDQIHAKRFVIDACTVVTNKGAKSIASLKARYRPREEDEWQEFDMVGQGDGGYDALMDAIEKIAVAIGRELPELVDYSVIIPPGGKTDALVQCAICWRGEKSIVTRGVNSDQVLAAAEATEKMLNLVL
ncbi:MAG TPA: alpha-isopropylmalate synthase regulatory domain-containing protein [Spirochaetia bacterium]|nr:alpha-isopropylmalate synthase regulatory domain-containing protein [Spirochaetia bacterium]